MLQGGQFNQSVFGCPEMYSLKNTEKEVVEYIKSYF